MGEFITDMSTSTPTELTRDFDGTITRRWEEWLGSVSTDWEGALREYMDSDSYSLTRELIPLPDVQDAGFSDYSGCRIGGQSVAGIIPVVFLTTISSDGSTPPSPQEAEC